MTLPVKQFIKQQAILLFIAFALFSCKESNAKRECSSFEEATLAVDVTSDWQQVAQGIQASVGDINTRYVQHEIPNVDTNNSWEGKAWRGEKVSAQIVLWTKDSIDNVELVFDDFKSDDGAIISSANTSIRFVKYVITDEFGQGCGKRKKEDYAESLSPDILDDIECIDLKENTTRPVWITIKVPADAVADNYVAKLELKVNGKTKQEFDFKLEVIDQELPPPSEWAFHLDLWQNPYAVARIENVEPWSDAHWKALEETMQMLANAGQKVITTTLNKKPWNGQTEDPFDTMIEWKKKTDGTWEYDYTVFDKWVEFMMGLGINKQINCYSMVPWGNRLFYFDEESNQEIEVSAAPGTQEYENLWKPFLTDFVAHLQAKGWENKTLIAMDERSPTEMKAMLKILEEVAPTLGVSLADNHKSYKLYPDQLVDLCVSQGATVDAEDRAYRAEQNLVTTWYVCCSHEFPNVFTFSDPAEATFIGWYTRAGDFDGFLRWAYNSWVIDPLKDSRFRTWPAGDTYIVYPQGRSSIRFERLVEGIQDAEKIRIIQNHLEKDTSDEGAAKLEEFKKVLASFNVLEKPDNLKELLSQGKQFLNDTRNYK